ncbi:MAG: MBL fold metallo-hydrolase [Gammaproteobacteria bacterium]|nr:MBL fold metallo-hydrolase [Gammaproteobacteria bacterium]
MNRKLQLAVLGFAAISILVYSLRAEIAIRLMERIAVQRMSSDALADLPDGLHLVLCGAGSPMPDPRRSGPCVSVIAGNTLVVVDAGTGGVRNLSTMGIPIGNIDALFLTHYHSDHIDGLGELATLRWVSAANSSPLPVVGPPGLPAVVNGFNQAYSKDAGYRHAHHGDQVAPLSGAGMAPYEVPEPADGQQIPVFRKDGLVVTMFKVEHAPVAPAVGYRFEYRGRSLLVSGDTVKSTNLQRMAEGVDLLVHEALAPKIVRAMHNAAGQAGNAILRKITEDILDYHTSPEEAAEIAGAAGVGHLLYYHIVPPLVFPGMQAAFLEGVSDAYDGPVTIGVDGTLISLPADNDKIISGNLK